MRRTLRSTMVRAVVFAAAGGALAGGGAVVAVGALAPEAAGSELTTGLAAAVGAALACAAVAWGVGGAAARRVTRPLERLAGTASSLAAGNLDVRAAGADGPREVRIVADAFNRLADEATGAIEQLTSEERRKSQFVSDVSHELRTPLTAIRGAAETLLDGDVDPEDQERFLSTIATEAERLTRLANDLLTLQRIEGATGELPLRRVDLRVAADRAAAMLEPLVEHRGATLEVHGSAPQVLGDVDRLQQVVANLVDNATRIAGDGGHVRVTLAAEGGMSVFSVEDNGPGIPEEDLPNLFDRFYRSDWSRARSKGGAGLGLSIVRAIVSAHAGTIEAENLPQGGSRFTVRLPSLPE